jgi:hypothetical protein
MEWIVTERKAAVNISKQKSQLTERLEITKSLLNKLRMQKLSCRNKLKSEREVTYSMT